MLFIGRGGRERIEEDVLISSRTAFKMCKVTLGERQHERAKSMEDDS
ncbi:hypothetical protein S7335_2328 [Synechococcus sp. PCC 7335]|nr:hypothetical protein S7335_2328 [Synechococcus sp. PCC 7335]